MKLYYLNNILFENRYMIVVTTLSLPLLQLLDFLIFRSTVQFHSMKDIWMRLYSIFFTIFIDTMFSHHIQIWLFSPKSNFHYHLNGKCLLFPSRHFPNTPTQQSLFSFHFYNHMLPYYEYFAKCPIFGGRWLSPRHPSNTSRLFRSCLNPQQPL